MTKRDRGARETDEQERQKSERQMSTRDTRAIVTEEGERQRIESEDEGA